jgi:serine protein kinase
MDDSTRLQKITAQFDREKFKLLNEEFTFEEYLSRIHESPRIIRTAYQRLYDMIVSAGYHEFERYRKKYVHYNFFDDLEIPVFGLEKTLDELVKFIRGAAGGYGTEKRVLLLHGPVGSAKSTICRLIKRGLEKYSATDAGAWYTYKWVDLPKTLNTVDEDICSMNEDPLKLLPVNLRQSIIDELNTALREQTPEEERSGLYTLRMQGTVNPRCKKYLSELLKEYEGDLNTILSKHIRVIRRVYSEADRVGIATFQPKDEKNQDATELTGDINYRNLAHWGSDSDPRAFNFDGEFCVGNRGFVEFIEMLKLQQEFLYDLLGATQEQCIKPKKFSQVSIDEVIFGHTNGPEFVKLKNNLEMEALRDRTVKIDVPYLLRWTHEIDVLKQDYGPGKVRQHVAPHTLEIAALWAILTRLEDDKNGALSNLVEKAELYDDRYLPGWTEDKVKELRDEYENEGMERGVSARYVQDKISNCLSDNHEYINAFMVLNELREGLGHSSLITKEEDRSRYEECIEMAIKKYGEIVKNEVQKALVADENAIIRLCSNYIDNVIAYNKKAKIKNKFTGEDQEPDERLMRAIEEKIGIPEARVPDYRREVSGFIGEMAVKGEKFQWDSNEELKRALEKKLFEDVKHQVKFSALSEGATVVDPETQEKIEALRTRLIKHYGYNEQSATDVLEYVGSIFTRGDTDDED